MAKQSNIQVSVSHWKKVTIATKYKILFIYQAKLFLFQTGLAVTAFLSSLCSCGVERHKYLGEWLVSGKKFYNNAAANCTKFVGPVLGILQKWRNISDEIRWQITQHCCLCQCLLL